MSKQPLSRGSEPMAAALWTGIGAFLICAFVLAFLPSPAGQKIVNPPKTAGATVMVLRADGHGSGVNVGNGYIITAAHVLTKGHGPVSVETDDGVIHSDVEVMWSHEGYDIALLRVTDSSRIGSAKLACRPPVIGEPVTVEGSPLELKFVRTHGFVGSGVTDILKRQWQSIFELDASISPGNSGGPVYDHNGAVIGIAVGIANGFSLSFAVPSSTVCLLMARA